MDWIWDVLQIKATTDKREIKRAYARRSKEIHPEENPEEFQKLYEAYQKALQYVSCGVRMWDGPGVQTGAEAENPPDTDAWDRYREFGLDLEAVQKKQRRQAKIERFLDRWEKGAAEWERRGKRPAEDWKEYLRSPEFQEIMWSPSVLETVTWGLSWYYEQRPETAAERLDHYEKKQEILLFFWELYGFEKLREENCSGEMLLLYKKLYPVYVNYRKREQYEKNKDEELKKERRHIWKLLMAWSGIFIIVMLGVFIFRFIPREAVFAGALIAIVLGAIILLFMDNKETKWF